jgi:branched-chain amino acid transport system permease protein
VNFSGLIGNFGPLTITGLAQGAIIALFALGYTLVYGVLKLINFAHSEVFMIGTFGALYATRWMGISPGTGAIHTGISLVLILVGAAIVAMAASGLTAVVLERVAYRPLRRRGAGRLSALISAIGASLFLQETFALWQGRNLVAFPRLMDKRVLFHVFNAEIRNDQLLVILGALVMMIVLDRFVRTTRLGRGVRAVAQSPETATLMGVNIDRVVTLTFLLGGLMAGAAGVITALYQTSIWYFQGFSAGLYAFTAAVMGGIGNIRGAVLGGFIIGIIQGISDNRIGNDWTPAIVFVYLIIIMVFRPQGLIGEETREAG